MTAYIARATLEARFGPSAVAQTAWRDGLEADAVIDAAIGSAGDVIDGYLAGGDYDLPLATVPPLVADLAIDIAWYKLWTGPIPDDVNARYRDALKSLADIQAGRLVLAIGAGTVTPVTTDTDILIDAPPRLFDPAALKAY